MDKDRFRELLQSFEQRSFKLEAGGSGCDAELDGIVSRTVAAASGWASSRRSSYSPQLKQTATLANGSPQQKLQETQQSAEPAPIDIDSFLGTVFDNGTSFPELEATHPLPDSSHFLPSDILKSTDAEECSGIEGMRVQQQLHTASRFRLTAGILSHLWFQVSAVTRDNYLPRAARDRLAAIEEDLVSLCSASLVEAGQLEVRAQEAHAVGRPSAPSSAATVVPDDGSFAPPAPHSALNIVVPSGDGGDDVLVDFQQTASPAPDSVVEVPLGARICQHAAAWTHITTDAWVLNTTAHGLQFDFSARPQYGELADPEYAAEESAAIEKVIRWDLGDKVIEEVPYKPDLYVSHMYTLRITGKLKALVDFRMLNKFLDAGTIAVKETPSLYALLRKNDWITRISIKCAYPSVPIHPDHRHYLVFKYDGRYYQYRALPFGISVASRAFIKLLQAALQPLRDEGYRITSHIDEICLLSSSYTELTERTKRLCRHLAELGFLINMPTSDLVPQQNQRFLGFVFNTIDSVVQFPKDQIKKIRRAAHTARSSSITAKQLASLLGKVRAIMPAIGSDQWRIQEIESCLGCSITNPESWDDVVNLSPPAVEEINWLCDNILIQKSMPITNTSAAAATTAAEA